MIPGIVLAGGDSSRMGRPKALLAVGHDSFLERIARVLEEGGVEEVIVVLGRDAERIRNQARLPSPRVRLIDNPNPAGGQLSSLLVGLAAADRPGVRAVLVTLIDVPLLAAATVGAVLAAYRNRNERGPHSRVSIVRPAREGRHGHPVIFDRSLFEELRRADRSTGARSVIRAHADEVLDVEVPDEGAFIDIDTPADYERFIATS